MARSIPATATKAATQLITGALWNAGPYALGNFLLHPPLCRARQNSAQAVANNTWTAAALQVTDGDSDSGHSNVTNNSRYTCQIPGWYWVEGYFALGAGAASRFDTAIAKNGTIVAGSSQFLLRQNDLQASMASTLVQLAVNDYVEMWGRQTSGGALNTFVGSDLLCSLNVFWVHS